MIIWFYGTYSISTQRHPGDTNKFNWSLPKSFQRNSSVNSPAYFPLQRHGFELLRVFIFSQKEGIFSAANILSDLKVSKIHMSSLWHNSVCTGHDFFLLESYSCRMVWVGSDLYRSSSSKTPAVGRDIFHWMTGFIPASKDSATHGLDMHQGCHSQPCSASRMSWEMMETQLEAAWSQAASLADKTQCSLVMWPIRFLGRLQVRFSRA